MKTQSTGSRPVVKLPEASRPAETQAPAKAERKNVPDAFAAKVGEPQRRPPTSMIRFDVHSGMQELKDFAAQQGWTQQGFTHLSIGEQELRYTVDNWKTTLSLRSTDVPSQIMNGMFRLPNIPKGTTVEFAIRVFVSCHAPADIAGYRERGDMWLNNGGKNYTQVTQ
jgi:hypothetical protein